MSIQRIGAIISVLLCATATPAGAQESSRWALFAGPSRQQEVEQLMTVVGEAFAFRFRSDTALLNAGVGDTINCDSGFRPCAGLTQPERLALVRAFARGAHMPMRFPADMQRVRATFVEAPHKHSSADTVRVAVHTMSHGIALSGMMRIDYTLVLREMRWVVLSSKETLLGSP